jgi:hypothetical protein
MVGGAFLVNFTCKSWKKAARGRPKPKQNVYRPRVHVQHIAYLETSM